jgi:hypothetical protein
VWAGPLLASRGGHFISAEETALLCHASKSDMGIIYEQSKHIALWIWISVVMNKNKLRSFGFGVYIMPTVTNCASRRVKKAQFVTVMGIAIQFL